MRVAAEGLLGVVVLAFVGCDSGESSPIAPSTTTATVRFDYRAATALSPNLPASTAACVSGVGQTHFHPTDLWQITFTDVPIDVRLALRVSDPCDSCASFDRPVLIELTSFDRDNVK